MAPVLFYVLLSPRKSLAEGAVRSWLIRLTSQRWGQGPRKGMTFKLAGIHTLHEEKPERNAMSLFGIHETDGGLILD